MKRMPPRTADGERFRFRAGRPSLDLCSTLLWRSVAPIEQLREPSDLSRWLLEAGLVSAPCDATGAELELARSLREALYGLFRARLNGAGFGDADLAAVNGCAAHPDRIPQLAEPGVVDWLAREPAEAALATVARDGIDLLAGPLAGRVRECAAPDCSFLFVDTSRPGRRRWCAASRCGNRQHVRDHRARLRDRR